MAALAGLAPERVVYVGSVSKTLAPALRLGWVVAPRDVREELVGRKQLVGHHTPALGQLALAELITSGGFERHLRKVRARQRDRRDALLDALARHLPGTRVHGVAAGLHLLVRPAGRRRRRRRRRTGAGGGRRGAAAVDTTARPGPPGLVLGYAATTPDRLREGVRLLADVM